MSRKGEERRLRRYNSSGIRGIYIKKKSKERLITAASNSNGNIRTKRETIKTTNKKWEEKQLYGYFKRQTGDIVHEKARTWQRKGNLRREIESPLIAAQNNVTIMQMTCCHFNEKTVFTAVAYWHLTEAWIRSSVNRTHLRKKSGCSQLVDRKS